MIQAVVIRAVIHFWPNCVKFGAITIFHVDQFFGQSWFEQLTLSRCVKKHWIFAIENAICACDVRFQQAHLQLSHARLTIIGHLSIHNIQVQNISKTIAITSSRYCNCNILHTQWNKFKLLCLQWVF